MQSEVQIEEEERVKDNSFAILFEKEDDPKLIQLIAGNKIQTSDGAAFRHASFINQHWASKIQAHNKPGRFQRALKPKSTLITQTLARKTQILYAMDNSAIIFRLNIVPGSRVIQAGTGSGSLSCGISQSLGNEGHLYTFEFNQQRAEITKQFFHDLGKTNITSTWRDVVSEGFHLQGVELRADALFLDVPNPWAAIGHAKRALKRRRICCFSPCIEQVQKTAVQLRKQKFANIHTIECLSRVIDISEKQSELEGATQGKRSFLSKPVFNNRGHTGFLTFAVSL